MARTTADFTIADVLAWARTKPADETYEYVLPQNCALCQFLRDTGRAAQPSVNPLAWRDGVLSLELFPIPDRLNVALQASTFGGLVARLEALCPETPVTKSDWLTIDAYMNEQVSV